MQSEKYFLINNNIIIYIYNKYSMHPLPHHGYMPELTM